MKVAAAYVTGIGRGSARRVCVTLILLLAFTLQAFITQTHVHRATSDRAPIGHVVGQTSATAAAHKSDEAIACPFCQAMLVAGAFFTPAPTILSTPASLAVALAPPLISVGRTTAAASFSWRSRAPPHH